MGGSSVMRVFAAAVVAVAVPLAAATAPSGLTVDFLGGAEAALGVRLRPSFGWVVPPCAGSKDAIQTAYSLAVYRDGEPGTPLWHSGKVQSNASVAVPYGGPALDPGAAYEWTVQTWSGSSCASAASARATFVTALDAFRPSAKWIGVGEPDATFNLVRRVVAAPAGARRVLGFITAQNTDACMLFNYKLFINGTLASAGPGRGEAPVAGGDGVYHSLPYITLDLTAHFSAGGPTVIALQTMQFGANAPAVLMQVNVFSSSGGTEPAQSWVTEASSAWRVLDADPWLRPNNQVDAAGIPGWDGRDERRCPGARARSAGSTRIEFTDARKEPVGWRSDPLFDDRGWKDAVEIQSAALRSTELTPRMAGAAVQILSPIEPVRVAPVPNASRPNDSAFFLDFGKEIQGGLILTVTGGSAGQVVRFRSGELCTPIVDGGSSSCVAVDQDWQWIFNWTLREGEQTIEQHQYQEWRYLSVVFEGSAPEHWSVSAWRVQAPWVADDSSFDSSSPMLNRVFELARYTLQAGVVDTYTDSNTRERRPYESDGLIAAANRHLLQRNTAMWARHSASWVLTFPTWPVEWSQMTPFLAHQDYMATGQTDLAEAYMDLLFNNTQIQWLNSATGLVNTTKPNARSDIFGLGAGRHLVGWAPSTGHAFAYSDFISTSNMYCARGLELLAELATAAGRTENATRFAGLAAALKRSIVEKMWDPKAERFCDGVCDDPKVAGKHSVYSDMYSLWLGMVPQPARSGVWRHVAQHGMTALGDYGVFVYLSALASDPAVDGGEAILTALTKCDNFSWCETMKLWDATMTRESLQVSLQHPTMSHAWGTSPVIGAVNGLLGLSQASPGFGTFSVRPRLGGLAFAAAKVPTAHGPVVINATKRSTEVHVPCNTLASLCAIAPPLEEQADVELALDGVVLHAENVRFEGQHACVDTLGCGEAGRARRVEWVTRLKLDDVQQQIAISLKPGVEFDGHGGLSAGGTSRLLIEYPEPQRSEILDFLFLPGFGAELGVLKLEIGGDTQSTDGTEPSHQHFRGDLGCKRGYEGWLASEAKKRNPDIRIWSLSWGVPGWIGNVSGNAPTFFCDDNIAYQVAWVKCLKDAWGVESDFLGLWNERPQGTVDYVIKLKQALTAAGFGRVGITAEATWQPFIRNALTDPQFAKAVVAGSVHYGCNESKNSEVAHNASMKWWAGEDTIGGVGPAPDGLARDGNWTGASCWGRKLSQHFLRMRATSTISWSVVWSAAPGVSSNGLAPAGKSHGFLGNGLLNATEPWSGHYHVPPTIWIMAHWHQFAKPGWRFLERGEAGGAGNLTAGGTYLTLVPPEGSSHPPNTFTLIVETLQGSCGPQGKCNVDAFDETQSLTFELKGPLAATKSLALWCSSVSAVFVKQPGVPVVRGTFSLAMRPDTICTATTLLLNGSKGMHPTPPPSARFPKRHSDDFSGSVQDTLPRGFSDVYGSFAVRPSKPGQMALTQVATAKPTGWAPTNLDPLTLIGDSMWADVTVNVTAIVNHSVDGTNAPLLSTSTSRLRVSDPPPPPVQPEYVRVCGGCGDTSKRGLSYGCLEGCCFQLAWSGNWSLGGEKTGTISDFKDTWHDIGIVIRDSAISATVDGSVLGSVSGSCPPQTSGFPGNGMVGLGCGSTPYHMCQFGSVDIEAGSGIGADPTTSAVSEHFQRTPLKADEARLAVTTPSATFTSDVHIVMDWDRDHCGTINNTQLPPMPIPPCTVPSAAGCDVDNIDSMPRVWWDAKHGFYRQLHNVATVQGPSRPQIGDSLTTLKHTCRPYTKLQQEDNVLSHFSDHVWVEAPYVLNETHVYALTHVDSYNGVHTAGGNVYSDLTLQKSTDGGGSFAQAFPAPHHLVATSPYDNFRNGMLQRGLGLGMPSSIIKDPKSDYLYVMALANWGKSFSAQAGGQCLLRTNDITDPGSWRAWNGANFTVTVNASPAVAPVQNPDAHTCAVLDLPLRHISLLWSSYYSKFLAFGELHQGVWAFALSDDLITWGPPTKIPSASLTWNMHGNATITPISPMPGRWTFAPKGSKYQQDVPIWIGAVNASGEKALSGDVYRWRAPCHTCSTMPCEPVPGMGDVCKLAKPIGLAEWSSIPAATVGFTAGLVSKLAGYVSYIYPTLVDDSEHRRTRSDPSLNVVGQTATVFFVANKCAGTDRNWRPGDGVPKCDITDAVRRDRRDVVRATIKFQKNEDPTSSAVSERSQRTPLKADEARLAVTVGRHQRPQQLIDRGSFETFALGSADLCDKEGSRNYHCVMGADKDQSGPSSSTVVGAPEPVRSGRHSLRSGPFSFDQGYRVEVIPANRSDESEGDVAEGFGVPVWYGFSVFLPANYSADEIESPDRIFQWHGDAHDPNTREPYRCLLNPVLTFEVLGPYVTLVQKMGKRGYHSPPVNGTLAVPLFTGPGSPCGSSSAPGCTAQDGRCAPHAVLDQFLHGWYSSTGCTVLGELAAWRNGWTDVVLRAVWNYNDSHAPPRPSDGQLDVWINGSKVFSRSGSNCYNDFGAPFSKFGIYKYPWKTNKSPSSPHGARVGPVKSRMLWHDEVYECKGEGCSYEAVQAKPVAHPRQDGPLPSLPTCAT